MGKHATVLIAARDTALTKSLRFALELEGFAVRELRDLSELLDGGNPAPPSCLVIDQELLMGPMSGGSQAVLRQSGVPAILLAGHRTQALMDRAKAAGITVIVEKPFLGAVLLDAVRKAVESASQQPPKSS